MTRRLISAEQMDRAVLLEERKVQLLTRRLRSLEAERGLEPAVLDGPDDGDTAMVIGDVVELFGVSYQFIGLADNGNAQLVKIKQVA